LRRADGRDWDGWLHVNPRNTECGLAMLYNPLDRPIERSIVLPLYYTGLSDRVLVSIDGQPAREMQLDRNYELPLSVTIPANGHTCILFEVPAGEAGGK